MLEAWLRPKGLSFNEDKTRVVDIDTGFDLVGFNVRRYARKLLIKPSPAAMRRIRVEVRGSARSKRLGAGPQDQPACARLVGLLPDGGASEAFSSLDDYMWKLTYKWATHGRQNKSRHWVVDRYFGPFNRARRNRWVFGDRDSDRDVMLLPDS